MNQIGCIVLAVLDVVYFLVSFVTNSLEGSSKAISFLYQIQYLISICLKIYTEFLIYMNQTGSLDLTMS